MHFNDYQTTALEFAMYPNRGNNFIYPIIALTEETGELAGKAKKLMRDKAVFIPSEMTDEDRLAMQKEMGDVLWYLAALAQELGTTLGAVAELNIAKISDRRERGVRQGSGDDR